MPLRKESLRKAELYLILDRQVNDDGRLFEVARESIRHGVDIIQLRDKLGIARDTLKCFKGILRAVNGRVPVIMNDRVDLAIAALADGVHLGQDDVPIRDARRMFGTRAVIGVSCQSYERARQAQAQGADYIGFGSVFKTLTKPERNPMNLDLLKKVVREISVPVFAIGGITLENIPALRAIGVRHFAVCRAICTARNIREATSDIKKEISGQRPALSGQKNTDH